MRRLRTYVDWLLPGCTVDQMREWADRHRPFWQDTDGRLKAKVRVRDGQSRLAARIIRLRRHQALFTRFSGEPVTGRPWTPEPLEGTGYRPFKPKPMIRFGRRR